MAIAPIAVGDTNARAKLNAAIDKANLVDSKASAADLAAGLANEASARTSGLSAEAAARQAAILALPLPQPVQHRPGDAPLDFGQALPEGENMGEPLAASLLRYDENGRVVRLTGDGVVAPRHLYAVEPSRRYLVTFVVQRRVNSPDPDNDAIRCALAWYGQGKGRLGATPQTIVQDLLGLTTGSGRQVVRAVIARAAGADVDIVTPAGARYCRPYVQTFGVSAQSDVEVINWTDITDAVAFAPDVSALEDRVTAVESLDLGARVIELESQVTAPNEFRVATIADLEAAMVPVSADTISVLGYYAPGDGGAHRRVAVPIGEPDLDDRTSLDGRSWGVAESRPSVEMFGARADWNGVAGSDNGTAINNAMSFAKARGGADIVFSGAGRYYTAATILIPERVSPLGVGSAGSVTGANAGAVQIVGALTLTPVVQMYGDSASRQTRMSRLVVSRQDGTVPDNTVGVEVNNSDMAILEDIFCRRHAYGFDVLNAAVGVTLNRCMTGEVHKAHLRYRKGVEITAINCRFGRNGGNDVACESYVEIDTTGGLNVDTVNFIRCQFNQSAGGVGALISFKGYASPNGIINFSACHAEGFTAGAGNAVVVKGDGASTVVRGLSFDDQCTINSSTTKNFFDVDAATVFSRFSFKGRTTFDMNLPSTTTSSYYIGGWIEGAMSCGGAGRLIADGVGIVGAVTLSGSISSLFLSGEMEGGLTDTSTGDKSINVSRAGTAGAAIPAVGRKLYISSAPRTADLAVRGVGHVAQQSGIDTASAGALLARYSANNSPPIYEMAKSRGASVGASAIVAAGDILGLINFSGDGGTSFRTGATIRAEAEGTMSAAYTPAKIVLSTAPQGSATPVDRLTIGTSGRYLSPLASFPNYADDTAAAAGGVAIGEWYRTGSALKIRAA